MKKVLIVDSDSERLKNLAEMAAHFRLEALTAGDGQRALKMIETRQPDLVICDRDVQGHSAQALCEYVREFVEGSVPFVLLVPAEETAPERVRQKYEANGVLRHPVARYELGNISQQLLYLGEIEQRLKHLSEENADLRKALQQKALIDPLTNFYRFDVFKQMIVLEVKRAKRYGYPLSILLMAFDNSSAVAGWLTPDQRKSLYAVTRRVVTDSIRDIDIPLLFAEEKVLVVMPHTDLEGSAVVADRIRDKIGTVKPPASLARLKLSVSIAVASTESAELRTFGMMIKEAMRGLQEANFKGGDVVLVCGSGKKEKSEEEKEGECTENDGKLGPRTYFL